MKRRTIIATSHLKNKGSAVLIHQLSLFNHNVIAHAVADATALCATHVEKARCMMQPREAKALQIIQSSELARVDNIWIVPSQTSPKKKYAVDFDKPSCTCADYEAHGCECKHVLAVRCQLRREGGETLPEAEKIVRRPYPPASWHDYNLSQTREKAYFTELLYQLCSLVEEPVKPRGKGRPPAPFADLIFAACVKIYGCISGRRNQSDLDEAVRRGYLSRPVRYNTLFKYLELEAMTPYLQQLITESSLPLKGVETDFAVDSSGFGTCQYVRWFDVKHGDRKEDKHDWVKLHLMTGVKTNIVTSVEVSYRYANDSPYFKPLVERTARNFTLREVSGDKGYSSFGNRAFVLLKGGEAYIPFKVNEKTSTGRPKGELWRRMFHYFTYHQEEFYQHYHKRSNVETTFSMIKARFGERLRSKTETAQINEALLKVLCHNICVVIQAIYELGIEADFIGRMDACLFNEGI